MVDDNRSARSYKYCTATIAHTSHTRSGAHHTNSRMASETERKRRRRVEDESLPTYSLDDADDNYEPYVPVAIRRQAKVAALVNRGLNHRQKSISRQIDTADDELKDEEKQKERERKERTLLLEAQEVHRKKAAEGLFVHFAKEIEIDESVQMHRRRRLN